MLKKVRSGHDWESQLPAADTMATMSEAHDASVSDCQGKREVADGEPWTLGHGVRTVRRALETWSPSNGDSVPAKVEISAREVDLKVSSAIHC